MYAKDKKIFDAVCILITLFVMNCLTSVSAHNSAPKLTAADWQADLKFLAEEMPKQHPNLFRRMKKEDFETAVKEFHDRISSLNEDEIIVGLINFDVSDEDVMDRLFNHLRAH